MKSLITFLVVAVGALLLGGLLSYMTTPSLGGFLNGMLIIGVLGLMETAESMDNAIVDAGILKTMQPVWQKRYLTLGMPIAVLGMRFAFPVIIVSLIASITPWSAVTLAFTDPHHYAEIMRSAKVDISAFGGAFLLMISLSFFLDEEKDDFWIKPLESLAAKFGGNQHAIAGLTALAIVITSYFLESLPVKFSFLFWGVVGIIAYSLIKETLSWLIGEEHAAEAVGKAGGLLTFLYLEFIDGSFSFDSAISAFAITIDPLLIALGLGIGAYVVRLMTLSLVKNNTLAKFVYVEHGAFYTILILAILMFVSVNVDVPEWVTGSIGAVLIGGSFIASIIKNKYDTRMVSH